MRGVRPDARMKNAKPLLLTVANSIESYWTWRSTQRVSGGGGGGGGDDETSENGLVTKVKSDLRNGRIVAELWLIAALSDGFIQPLMYAINEDDQHKSMLSMTAVLRRIRLSVSEWARGANLPSLLCGWLVGHIGTSSTYTPPTADIISGAFDLLDRTTRIEFACVCRRTHWNVQKMRHVSAVGLSCIFSELVKSIDHFTPEYRDGSLHAATVKHIARACPTNNDYVEGMFGVYTHRDSVAVNATPTHKEAHVLAARNHTIEWALSQTPEQLASILAGVRQYRQSLHQTLKTRADRDAQLTRERSEQLAADNAKRHANRTKRMAVLSQVPILQSIGALHTSLAQHTGKTALHAFLKQQLNLYKHPPYSEKACIRFSVNGVAHTCEQLQQLLESLIRKHFPATANSAAAGAGGTATSDTAPMQVDTPATAGTTQPVKRRRGRPPKKAKLNVPAASASSSSSSSSAAAATPAAVTPSPARRPILSCCGQPDNDGDLCVQCDTCRQWKHCECEGVDYEDAQDIDEFECQQCAAVAASCARTTP